MHNTNVKCKCKVVEDTEQTAYMLSDEQDIAQNSNNVITLKMKKHDLMVSFRANFPSFILEYLHLYFHCFNILYRTNEVHSSMNTVSLITAQRYGKH